MPSQHLWVVVLSLLVVGSVAPKPPKPATGLSKPIAVVQVDLDLPPKQRWQHIVSPLKGAYEPIIAFVNQSIPEKDRELATKLFADLDFFLGKPWADELRGVAAAAEQPLGDIVLLNLFYELNSACTSIVAANKNGSVVHGRNLDYNLPGLQNITVSAEFVKGGKVQFRGTTFAGYVGLLTGMRKGAFSVSIDERWTQNGTIWTNAFEALFKRGKSIGFFLRELLEAETTYDGALAKMQSQHLISVCYLIIGSGEGDGRGAVVTRDRDAAADTWTLGEQGRWFEVETNYDHWKAPEDPDDRRDPAIKHMNQTTATAVNAPFMFTNVMNVFPNLNSETVYTVMMDSSLGYYTDLSQNIPRE